MAFRVINHQKCFVVQSWTDSDRFVLFILIYIHWLYLPIQAGAGFQHIYTWKVNKSYGRDNDVHDNMGAHSCVSDNWRTTSELLQLSFRSFRSQVFEKIKNTVSAHTVDIVHTSFLILSTRVCKNLSLFLIQENSSNILRFLQCYVICLWQLLKPTIFIVHI